MNISSPVRWPLQISTHVLYTWQKSNSGTKKTTGKICGSTLPPSLVFENLFLRRGRQRLSYGIPDISPLARCRTAKLVHNDGLQLLYTPLLVWCCIECARVLRNATKIFTLSCRFQQNLWIMTIICPLTPYYPTAFCGVFFCTDYNIGEQSCIATNFDPWLLTVSHRKQGWGGFWPGEEG